MPETEQPSHFPPPPATPQRVWGTRGRRFESARPDWVCGGDEPPVAARLALTNDGSVVAWGWSGQVYGEHDYGQCRVRPRPDAG